MQPIKILIVDDDARFRKFVKSFLSDAPGIQVIGEARDGQEALRQARELKPALVLMDLSMPGMNGLDATYQLKAEMPEICVIMLTIYDEPEYREAVIAKGANGYVIKQSLLGDLLPAIRKIF